jgi:hypothetical protein
LEKYAHFNYKEDFQMTLPGQAKALLWGDIGKMSEDPGRFAKNPFADFTRSRKLDFEDLLRFLISMQSGTTTDELLKYFNYDIDTLSNSAFYQQRKKLLPDTFPFLLRQFNSHFDTILFRGVYNLLSCDGSGFNIARNPDDPDTFHPPNGSTSIGFNMLHLVALYDLLSKRYLDCVVQKGRLKNEFQALCDLLDGYSYGGVPIFIADRGFASYNVFAHAHENNRLFLIRAKDINARRILNIEALPDSIDTSVDLILSRTQSAKKRLRPDLAGQYRYVSSEVSFDYIQKGSCDEYPLSLRVLRFDVADGVLENIITNLPADEFSANDIMQLYHLRWGIETSFRDLKHTIGTINFHSKKVEYIEQEIWARLILFNFCAIITTHVVIAQKDTKHVYQVNYSMAMKICHRFIRLKEDDPTFEVERLIGSFTLPIRPGRNYARRHRPQSPASFCYRFS